MYTVFWVVVLTWSVTGGLGTLFTKRPDNCLQAGAKLLIAGPLCWIAFSASLLFFAARGGRFRGRWDEEGKEQRDDY